MTHNEERCHAEDEPGGAPSSGRSSSACPTETDEHAWRKGATQKEPTNDLCIVGRLGTSCC